MTTCSKSRVKVLPGRAQEHLDSADAVLREHSILGTRPVR